MWAGFSCDGWLFKNSGTFTGPYELKSYDSHNLKNKLKKRKSEYWYCAVDCYFPFFFLVVFVVYYEDDDVNLNLETANIIIQSLVT